MTGGHIDTLQKREAVIAATVVVPTTGDRGPLLRYSVDSILRQTVQGIEVFIIGDGIDERTRRIIDQLIASDPRVRLFDHPKHERRGEIYRHQALQSARGKIICYLCDRDLMLRNHVEVMVSALKSVDLCSTLPVTRSSNGAFDVWPYEILAAGNRLTDSRFGLSMGAHSLEAYANLPYGWRTTPLEEYTDRYMWQQFLDHGARTRRIQIPTIIYLPRGTHPGLPTQERLAEIEKLHALYVATQDHHAYIGAMVKSLIDRLIKLERRQVTHQQKGAAGFFGRVKSNVTKWFGLIR